ncbi:MAG TPA: hypothetical protein VFT38_14925, partial [Vicinamibacteria bacterium]|nr:hypothetical protein [Vicinamibacteria bacterium]
MIRSWKDMAALAAVIVLSVVSAVGLTRLGPPPAADVARGSEEAFGRGLQRRELPPGAGPQRWTTAHAAFTFRDLPRTSATLTVEIRDARGPVTVVADGVVVGRLDPAVRAGAFPLAPTGRRTREVELWSEPFRAGDGRLLGALLGRVAIATAERDSWPPPAILLELLLPALVALASSRLAGLRPASALAVALVTIALATAALWPSGLAHSPYGPRLGALSCAGSVLALAFARSVATRHPAAAAAAFVALTAGWWVQVVAATSPVMVVSDVVFHANKLAAVSAGELFPVSVTQHARPFRFPYGVSFYAVLAPLARAGLDAVELVRVGAAAAGLAATAAVFLLALSAIGPCAAALAAVLLQVLPGAFDVAYSYGNLSNAFGQSATVLFFCWWAGRAPGRWPVGAALLALAALAHFSSFVFVVALVAALVIAEMRSPEGDRTRLWAAGIGLLLAAGYYAHFAGLIWEQVPRLLEGGGQGRGASRSAWDALRLQVVGAIGTPWHPLRDPGSWGLPAVVLAWLGRPRPTPASRYERDLAAYWLAGLALALPAILSPLEVRYLYGLTAAVALCAGGGAARLEAAGGARRLAGRGLVVAQIVLGARAIAEAVVVRYRL